MNRRGILLLAASFALGPVEPGWSQEADSLTGAALPPGVTAATVDSGRIIYQGAGLCFACHGPDGRGGVGPDLVADSTLHELETFDALVRLITLGVNENSSFTGQVMPARGGSAITPAQVRAVAAYVWAIRRRTTPP